MPSTIDTLISRIADSQLRAELRAAVGDLRKTTDFGLVFETHLPETVRLPNQEIRRGVKVTFRDAIDQSMFEVVAVRNSKAAIRRVSDPNGQALSFEQAAEILDDEVLLSDLVAIADFDDPIYPGLSDLGAVVRGGDKPTHVIIKGENYHALEALQFTHSGRVDCVYIDPPYNTGARDWKYNNNYVDTNDRFRHSKWLSSMDRRLRLAKNLLKPGSSILLVTIDDNEVYSLGLLLDQVFHDCERQMVDITVSPRGKSRVGRFSQVDEYMFVVYMGAGKVLDQAGAEKGVEVRWRYLRRNDVESARGTVKGGPNQFYPIYVNPSSGRIVQIGSALQPDEPLTVVPSIPEAVPVFPIREDGMHMNWGLTAPSLQRALDDGYVRVTPSTNEHQRFTFAYLTAPNIKKVARGEYEITGVRPDGSKIVVAPQGKTTSPTTAWREPRYDAGAYGTTLLGTLIPNRKFPFPKSLYAVEDCLRYFIKDNPDAVVLDFFGGSGTTAHAVMRLNHADGGRRQSITVTNNEVSEDEAKALRKAGHKPGDVEWEQLGIFEYVTRPRLTAAVTGRTPEGLAVGEAYCFTDEFPMGDGMEENLRFFDLTYLDASRIEVHLAFTGIAALLWLRAGGRGPIIDRCSDGSGRRKPYAWTDRYGILFNTDRWRRFVSKLPETATTAYVVTDSQTEFSHIAGELPGHLDVVRLYERYLTTFAVNERR